MRAKVRMSYSESDNEIEKETVQREREKEGEGERAREIKSVKTIRWEKESKCVNKSERVSEIE